MDLVNRNIQYQLDGTTGDTVGVTVGMYGKSDVLEVTANTNLTAADVAEGSTLDDLSRKELFNLAKTKLPGILAEMNYTNYQYFVTNDEPVRLTAYLNHNDNSQYATASVNMDATKFKDKKISETTFADIKTAVAATFATELPQA